MDRCVYRFNDPLLPAAAVLPGLLQLLDVLGQDKRAWEEAKVSLAEARLHLGQVPPQAVLPADLEGPGEVVELPGGEGSRDTWSHLHMVRPPHLHLVI